MTFTPPANTVAIADQIAKGVDPKRCTYRLIHGHFLFFYGEREIGATAIKAWIKIGGMSCEYLEMLCQDCKARQRRQRIRMHIRQLREHVKHNIERWCDDE